MSRVYLRDLGDIRDKGLVLRVICGGCGRVSHYGADEFIQRGPKATIRVTTTIAELEPRLVCRGGGGMVGCGAKMAELVPLWPHELPHMPKGVPILPWLRADERERKRLLRIARG